MGAIHSGHTATGERGTEARRPGDHHHLRQPQAVRGATKTSTSIRATRTATCGSSARPARHLIYLPDPEEIYPPGFCTTVTLAGPAKAGLEDKFRPQFFDGVATVVAKLFIQTGADYAMFGEKDYQQLKVVTRMARDLDIPIEVVGVPTVREEDGLAKSSRNVYLSKPERQQALAIYSSTQPCRRAHPRAA